MNSVNFFEVSTDEPEKIQNFYATLFGWQYHHMPERQYSFITLPGKDALVGGIFDNEGKVPNWALFCVGVEDVEKVCHQVVELGGTITYPMEVNKDETGTMTAAQFLDPSGNRFAVASFVPNQPETAEPAGAHDSVAK
jgi:predicted enzyme related to lactoylglutathione lyase